MVNTNISYDMSARAMNALWMWEEKVQPIVFCGMVMKPYASPLMRHGIDKVIHWLVTHERIGEAGDDNVG